MIIIMAWRNIWRNKMRSLVILFSIALGLFAGIAVLALYKGMMSSRVRTVIDEEVAHIQMHHPQFKKDYEPVYLLQNASTIVEQIKKIPQVKAVAERSIAQGMLSNPTGSTGVQIKGIEPSIEYTFSLLKEKLKDGKGFTDKKQEILIGRKLADKMKLKTGSKLVLTFTDTSNSIISGAFKVAGIYESNNTKLDEQQVYVRKDDLNWLLGFQIVTHEIAILLHKDEDLDQIAQQLKQATPSVLTETWKDISPETDLMVKTVDDYSNIIMIIIMLALAFGIINTMLMAIIERTREVGMMTALGTSKIRIFLLVVTETVLLTLAGTPVGVFTGWIITNYYHQRGLDLSGMGKEMMSSFGFRTMIFPEFPSDKIFYVFLIVVSTAILSGIFPAIRALSMKPIDALRI